MFPHADACSRLAYPVAQYPSIYVSIGSTLQDTCMHAYADAELASARTLISATLAWMFRWRALECLEARDHGVGKDWPQGVRWSSGYFLFCEDGLETKLAVKLECSVS